MNRIIICIYASYVLNWVQSLDKSKSHSHNSREILCINTESKSILMHAHHIYLAFFSVSLSPPLLVYPLLFHTLTHTLCTVELLNRCSSIRRCTTSLNTFISPCRCGRVIMILIYPHLRFYLWASIRNSISGKRNSFNNSLQPHTHNVDRSICLSTSHSKRWYYIQAL